MAKGRKAAVEPGEEAGPTASSTSALITSLVDEAVSKHGDGGGVLEGYKGISLKLRGVLSTGCAVLDVALGRGGIPQGRLTILDGADGSGKTTQALHLVAEAQRLNGLGVYIDKEHKLDLDYAASLGVDVPNMPISQPDHLEGTLAIMDFWMSNADKWRAANGPTAPIVLVLDSMNACVPKAEFESDWDSQFVGLQARVFSAKLPRIVARAQRSNTTLVFVAQLRDKIGVLFGRKTDISGGRSPKHHASCIVEYTRVKTLKVGGDKDGKGGTEVGIRVKGYVSKNQVAPPFKSAEFTLRFGTGFDKQSSLIEAALDAGIVERSGSWYSIEGDRLGQGLDNAADRLRSDPSLERRLRKALNGKEFS